MGISFLFFVIVIPVGLIVGVRLGLKRLAEKDISWLCDGKKTSASLLKWDGQRLVMRRAGLPNWLSIIRFSVIPVVPYFYIAKPFGEQNSFIVAGIISILIIATDGVDGFIARRLKQTTRFGRVFDPIADKVSQYLPAIGIIAAAPIDKLLPIKCGPLVVGLGCAIIVIRDLALLAIWRVMRKGTIGPLVIDKVRSLAIAGWIIAIAVDMALGHNRILTAASHYLFIVSVTLSCLSMFLNFGRWRESVSKMVRPK